MWVVKIGGSLAQGPELKQWLQLIADRGAGEIVIVPGGGVFADCVRSAQQRLGFNDRCAHMMAVLAMRQMACLFHSLQPQLTMVDSVQLIRSKLSNQQALIWSPDIAWLDAQQVPSNWAITSDSLSAILATQLEAERLVLIKSANVNANTPIDRHMVAGVVDAAFKDYIENIRFNIDILNKHDIDSMIELLGYDSVER